MMKPQSPIDRLLALLLLLVLMLAFTACHDEPEEPILPQPDATFSGTLPVLYINTEGGLPIVSQDEYLHADWWIDDLGLEGYESIGSREEPLGMLIKGRGNWSWRHYYKKPYRIKLDEKKKLLGMKKSRHFILMAHADQDRNDFMTNTVGFELSRRIGLAYTPAQEPVEVVLNGQYIGLYFVTEKIRVDKIEKAAEADAKCWPAAYQGWMLRDRINSTLKPMMQAKVRFLNEQWGEGAP